MKYLFAIDPSINTLGYAFWREEKLNDHGLLRTQRLVDEFLTSTRKTEKAWMEKVNGMTAQVLKLMPTLHAFKPVTVVVEMPETFRTAKGRAAHDSDAIRKLNFFVGFLAGRLRKQGRIVVLVNPSEWKGQVPKAVTIYQVNKRHGLSLDPKSSADSNIADAIGLGDWYLKHKEKS